MNGTVTLREVAAADIPTFFEQQLDPEATRMGASPSRNQEAFAAHWAKVLADPKVTVRTVLFRGAVAGNIVSFEQGGQRLAGYWIGREFWGKGIATRALSSFLEVDSMRPLFAHVAKRNLASIRVLEKCGFAVWGEASAVSIAGGEPVDELIMKID